MAFPRNALELAADIERRIAEGHLVPGERLDPVRVVADAVGLAPNTVAAAYRTLGERGYLVGRGRRGTFVADRPPVVGPAPQGLEPGLIDLRSGFPDLALLPPLRPALDVIATDHVLYDATPVEPGLAAAVTGDLTADRVPAANLAVVNGALDGIERVLAAHLRPGDKVAVEDPGYTAVTDLVAAMRLRPVPVVIDHRGPDPEALARVLAEGPHHGIRALVVTPRAQNPTGAALDAARAAELRAVVAQHPDTLVVEDDHAWSIAGVEYHRVVSSATRHWAVVRSVAKSLGPDLRLAVIAGDATTIDRVQGRQALGPGWVSHLLQRTVATLIADPATAPLLATASDRYRTRRAVVVDRLLAAGHTVTVPSGWNVWVPVADEAAVVAGMQAEGFAVSSGTRFRLDAGPGVRLSVGAADDEVLARAADVLVELLSGRRRGRRRAT